MFHVLLSISILVALLAVGAVRQWKVISQRKKDAERRVYVLSFPADLDVKRLHAWLRSVAGTLASSKWRIGGAQTVVFETHATAGRIAHYLEVPWQQADHVIEQLHGLAPGVNARPVESRRSVGWTTAVEVGETRKSRLLRIQDVTDAATSILSSLQSLKDNEEVLVQWVVTPANLAAMPSTSSKPDDFSIIGSLFGSNQNKDDINERREKLKDANFMGVLRVAAKADTPKTAKHLIYKVRSAFKAVESPENKFRIIESGTSRVIDRVSNGSGMYLWPAQLAVPELAALIGWRINGLHVSNMPTGRAKYHHADQSVPNKGRIFGDSNEPGHERPVAVSVVESCKHFHIVGRTGSGKTELEKSLAAQDIYDGRGVIVIDPKHDLASGLLDLIPKHRINDVAYFDVNDHLKPLGFNILGQGSPQTVASEVQAIFNHIYSDSGLVRMPEVLYHVLITLMTTTAAKEPLTFLDAIPLLWPGPREEQMFRKAVIDGVTDPYIRSWWTGVDKMSTNERGKYFESLRARIWQLNARSEMRHIIGQSESSIDMREIVSKRKILIVNLHGLPTESASLIGSLIVNNLWHAIKEGRSSQENPVSLFLDEFQHFVHSPINPETMLAEARSFGLSMHLAHQGLDQLAGKRQLEDAVMNNAVNKIIFQRGLKDSRVFASEFGSPVTDDDMKKLGKYEFMARVATDDGISPPLTGITRSPLEPYGYSREVREASRAKFGKTPQEVEQEIVRRRALGGVPVTEDASLDDEDYERDG